MISISTTKSGSNWLDRLRSSRGFPTGCEPDLDQSLASSSSSSARTDSSTRPNRREKKFTGDVADVLSELFNMGECTQSCSKPKNCRKQPHPRFFHLAAKGKRSANIDEKELCSSDDLREKEKSELVSSGDNSLNDKKKKNESKDIGDDEDDDVDLRGYSRSEVTVIDTSFSVWKSDKWVYRKGDEWKVREKKKNKPSGKKKKSDNGMLCNEKELCNVDEMKLKGKVDDDGEKGNEKVKVLHLNKGLSLTDTEPEPLKEPANFVAKVPQNRFPCPRPPQKRPPPQERKPEPSRVILLNPIPMSSGDGVLRLGKSPHKKRPKKMKII